MVYAALVYIYPVSGSLESETVECGHETRGTGLEITEYPHRFGEYTIPIQVCRLYNVHTGLEIIQYSYRFGDYEIPIYI
jgi:hypothetical protein